MNLFLRIDINLVAIALLGITFLIAYKRLDKRDKLNEIFLNVSIIIILEIIFETLTCVINGQPDQRLIPFSFFLHMCLFITAPILTYFWYTFVHYWVMSDDNISKKNNILLLIPLIVNFIIAILSPFYDFIFYIDYSNEYHRGSLFILSSLITYFYIILSFVLLLKQKKKIFKEEFLPLFVFGILPMIGGLLQTMFYGILLMWSCTAFSLVIVYNFLQQRMIHLDNVSGAWTRSSFDYYISKRVQLKEDEPFGLIFADIDGLKNINDKFGHLEGDFAIKTAIKLIKSVLRENDVIARFGGDEFVIVLNCDTKLTLEKTIERIKVSFVKYNENSDKGYALECSFGADIFDVNSRSLEQFLYHVDNLMYCSKNQKKLH